MKVKLAEALLRRKELQDKVNRYAKLDPQEAFEIRVQRKKVTDAVDDVIAAVPKISMNQFTHAYDWHAKNLRLVDAAIQQANWTSEIDVDESVMGDYVDPYVKN